MALFTGAIGHGFQAHWHTTPCALSLRTTPRVYDQYPRAYSQSHHLLCCVVVAVCWLWVQVLRRRARMGQRRALCLSRDSASLTRASWVRTNITDFEVGRCIAITWTRAPIVWLVWPHNVAINSAVDARIFVPPVSDGAPTRAVHKPTRPRAGNCAHIATVTRPAHRFRRARLQRLPVITASACDCCAGVSPGALGGKTLLRAQGSSRASSVSRTVTTLRCPSQSLYDFSNVTIINRQIAT